MKVLKLKMVYSPILKTLETKGFFREKFFKEPEEKVKSATDKYVEEIISMLRKEGE